MQDFDGKTETPLAAIRAGGDLQVVCFKYTGTYTIFEVQAFDTDGNPLAVLGAFVNEQAMYSTLPTLVELAREMYGSEKARHRDEFNLVAWRWRETGTSWSWAGSGNIDENLSYGLGAPRTHPPKKEIDDALR